MLDSSLFSWNDAPKEGGDGVMIGCDEGQEWLLKWFWFHYAKENSFPVTFVDFGMSKSALRFCAKKGNVLKITLPKEIVGSKEDFSLETKEKWEDLYAPNVFEARKGWLSKPFALLRTPYQRTAWIDLDAQVRKSITPLIDACEEKDGIAIVREVERSVQHSKKHGLLLPGETVYNAGILSFRHGSPIIAKWAENIYYRGKEFMGDTDILNRTIFEENFQVVELPSLFNRRAQDGITKDTVIVHFVCSGGKQHILKKMDLSSL